MWRQGWEMVTFYADKGSCHWNNSNISCMFCYEVQQVQNIADWWQDKIQPNDRPTVRCKIDRALPPYVSDGVPVPSLWQLLKLNLWSSIYYHRWKWRGFACNWAMQNIKNHKESELELIELNKEITILENIGDGLFSFNKYRVVT